MKDPPRLVTEDGGPLQKLLLESFDADRPSRHAKQVALATLGIEGIAAAGTASVSGAVGPAGAKVAMAALAKAFGAGAIAGAVALGAARYAPQTTRPASPTAPAVGVDLPGAPSLQRVRLSGDVAISPSAPPTQPDGLIQPISAAASSGGSATGISVTSPSAQSRSRPVLEQAPIVRDTDSKTPPSGALSASPEVAKVESPLTRELALLDRARIALRGRRYTEALASLGEYDREIHLGELAPEAEALRIEALVGLGDRTSARDLARHFLQAYPTSARRSRVQAIIDAF